MNNMVTRNRQRRRSSRWRSRTPIAHPYYVHGCWYMVVAVLVTATTDDERYVVAVSGRSQVSLGVWKRSATEAPALRPMLRHSRVDGRDKHGHDANYQDPGAPIADSDGHARADR